jgi:hypothetical protein
MSSTHLIDSGRTALPRKYPAVDRSVVRRELLIAGALFLAVVIAEAAFIFAAARYIPDAASIYVTVT